MKHFFSNYCAFLLLLAGISNPLLGSVPGGEPTAKAASTFYASGLQEGRIGVTEEIPVDNPADNIFHVALEEAPSHHGRVWLVYELEGVEDHTAVSRSINDQLAIGGYLVKQRTGWARQREQIDARWLKEGDNVIRFTIPEGAKHSYRVRNLSVEVEKSSLSPNALQAAIIVNQPAALTYAADKVYIKGFVPGLKGDAIQIRIDGQPARVSGGSFEAIVQKPSAKEEASLKFALEAVFPDGKVVCREVAFSQAVAADFTYTLEKEGSHTQQLFTTQFDCALSLKGAGLEVSPGALQKAAHLSITSLREVDVPALDPGMINVTNYNKGFRFLPHGQIFEQAVKLRLAYDESKIPAGYTAKDIKTYFFDEETHHWVPLPADSLMEEEGALVSRTTHFTDMINAIIQVPESPEVNAYNSTSMKGIKAANPTAAMNLLSPPQANNTGNASMGYPIKLPAGRNGMQPQLAISYNSGGGNSWLGLGWNLNIPALTVDTRWGVPRYDEELESETYSLNGEMLSPVAHRGEPLTREVDKRFYPRVEGAFNKIERKGNHPSRYFWTVTDKGGTKYYYGGESGVADEAVLKDAAGNIAHWALVKVEDLTGNSVRYEYEKVVNPAVAGGSNGQQLYISKITYTDHASAPGKYSVLFSRSQERRDITINARYGFKQVTADLLEEIEVQYQGNAIRRYELGYTTGAFEKSLLENITEFDAENTEFSTHTFDYYNEVYKDGTFAPFGGTEEWNVPDNDIVGMFETTDDRFNGKASVLSGTHSRNKSVGMNVGVGFDLNAFLKTNSITADLSYANSSSSGMVTFVDMNGDGLPDKVFVGEGNQLYYSPNESGPAGGDSFGDPLPITISGVRNFHEESSNTFSGGIQSQFGFGQASVFVAAGTSKTISTTSVYISEVNGDQLPDIISNGIVYFNTVDPATGLITFVESSDLTPSPIAAGQGLQDGLLPSIEHDEEAVKRENPLHDMVRVWIAPMDGRVRVEGEVQLLSPLGGQLEPNADGVQAVIQLENSRLWRKRIQAGDETGYSPSGTGNVRVRKGNRLYFRLQSVENGSNDSVSWSPTITYLNKDLEVRDANGKSPYRFSINEDYLLAAEQEVGVSQKGTVVVKNTFRKPLTSDDVKVLITRERNGEVETIYSRTYGWDEVLDDQIEEPVTVDSADVFRFQVLSATTIDWPAIDWQPYVYYTSLADGTEVMNGDDPMLEFYAVPSLSLYAGVIQQTVPWEADSADTLLVSPDIAFESDPSRPTRGSLIFTIKKQQELIAKDTLEIDSGRVVGSPSFSVIVEEEENLFFEYHLADSSLAAKNTKSRVSITANEETTPAEAGMYYHKRDNTLGPLHRGWGHFAYNGNGDRAERNINQEELTFSQELKELDKDDYEDIDDPEDFENRDMYNPKNENFFMLIPYGEQGSWYGHDNLSRLDGQMMQSSRYGLDDVKPASYNTGGGGEGARGINKISESGNTSLSGGLSVDFGGVGAGASGSYSFGPSRVVLDFMDMNGDRYPDVVSPNKIQYSQARGGLSNLSKTHLFGDNHQTYTESWGASLSGTPVTAKVEPKAYNIKNVDVIVGSGQNSAGVNGSFARGDNRSDFTYMDINGDGLPDRLFRDATDNNKMLVRLNLGYSFGDPEDWMFEEIQTGESTTLGGGLGISIAKGSISAGVSYSLSDNHTNYSLQDVNGDGLQDMYYRLEISEGEWETRVRLNLGNGFSEGHLVWTGVDEVSKSRGSSSYLNAAFTAGVPIPLFNMKIIVNPSVSVGKGVTRELVRLADVDGDGFPDFVKSDANDELKVKRSAIGKTNLLKSVQRPMGANFALEYERTGNTYQMPNAAWTLSEVTVFDGFTGDGVDTLRSSFVYKEAYYDRHEREFYGFGKVISQTLKEDKAVYTRLVQTFHNDTYYNKGLLQIETMEDAAGKKWVEKENSYEFLAQGDRGERVFPALKETYQRFYEGLAEAGIVTSTSFEYDANGNVSRIEDKGIDGTEDDLFADILYHSLAEQHVLSMPKEIIVTGTDKTYRKREADINNLGQVTEIRQYLNNEEAAVHNLQYDSYGNLQKLTRPENEQGQRMEVDYEYDEVVHSYVTQVSNSYGYSSGATYDYSFGQLLSSTDLNGNEISYEIDAVGRVTKIIGPYEKAAGKGFTIEFDYHPEAEVPWALTRHYDPANPENAMETATFVDGLGRVLQTKKDAAIYQGEGAADKEMMIVSGKVVYDALGRAVKAWYPITEASGKAGEFNRGEDAQDPSTTTYDVLGRALKVTLPDGAFSQTHYGFASDHSGQKQFSTRSIDPNEITTEQFTDARGRVTGVRNAGDIWTSFVYNAMGEQLQAINDLGHATVSAYDQLGRRTSREHPDAGRTEYGYDLAGNLTELLTANLRESGAGAIRYTYDFERLTSIEYPQNPENNVHYTYGEAGEAHNRAGRIVIQEDASGAQEFFYGPLGEVVKNIRTIVIPQHDEQTYTTEWTYDTWNRLTEMVYADGEKVEYTYNVGGLLRSMEGKKKGSRYSYVEQLGYDKFEQRVYLEMGNGTKTHYEYEPDRRRLKNMVAKTANGRAMMDNVYEYDKVNNILSLTNNAPIPTSSLMGGSSEYHYEYDDLYRLTNAQGSFKGSNHEHRYSLAMSYNTVGGIESKSQLHERKGGDENEWNEQKKTSYSMAYEYGQEQPNAPMHIGKQAYSYDKNGNQTGWTHDVSGQRRRILWDEENRIRTIYDNGAAFHYTYDASGTRVLKGRSSGQAAYVNNEHKGGSGNMGNYTVYVNPYLVLRSGGYTKHYYIEGQRIVSKLGGGMADAGKSPKAGKGKVNYSNKQEESREGIVRNLKFLGHDGAILTAGKSGKVPPGQIIGDGTGGGKDNEKFQYFYHPDHLGSSSYITDASGEVYQHLEYFAFGETFVEEHSNTHRTPYLFNGKELDEETGLYYYGARYYDAQTSVWLAVDPKMDKYPGWSAYNYTFNNPIIYTDPDGRDAILVVFPDYKVDTETRLGKLPLGHAGVLLIDNKTGMTKYYEYGRYPTTDGTKGRVRSSDTDRALRLSNVVIDPETGKPTKESLNKVLGEISKKSGQGGRIQGAYVEGDFEKMNAYAQEKLKESNPQYEEYDKNRDPYSLTGNNCGTFGDDVIKQDTEAKKEAPWIFNPTPDNIANEYQDNFPKVNYDPKTNTTTSGIYKGEDQ